MPKICYQPTKFSAASLKTIQQANDILREYATRGIVVTLRQLYYQFVARDLIRNKMTEYKRLGSVINDARLAGLIDWDYLQDRTRNLNSLSHWSGPGGIINSAAMSYHRDLWEGQPNYCEIWIEKDALIGVIEGICQEWDVPYFSCRGYTSQSEMWGAAQRLIRREKNHGQDTHVIHLGDHDPSGKDMSRDIQDRLWMFGARTKVNRIALNMDQVEQYEPPPNPAKLTDSRASGYVDQYGDESWELDALDPDVLVELIRTNIEDLVDRDMWDQRRNQQEDEREILIKTSRNWDKVAGYVEQL